MTSVSSHPPDRRPSHHRAAVPDEEFLDLADDIAAWIDALSAMGLERRVAHRLTLIAVVLVALREMPSFLGLAAEHIEVALSDLDTFEVVQVALVEPDFGDAWHTLSAATTLPISQRCQTLARMSRRNGLRVVAP